MERGEDMSSMVLRQNNLPDNIEELSRFALVGREKLAAVRAEIRAIDRLRLARDVKEQKLHEAQNIAEIVIDAEKRIGELLKGIPKATNNNPGGKNQYQIGQKCSAALLTTSKQQSKETLDISDDQAKRFMKLAENTDLIEQAKAEARENGKIVTRDSVLEKAKKAERERRERQREGERVGNAEKVARLDNPLEAQGLYQTIVVDPPWDWGDEGDVDQFGRARPDYATMPIGEIEKLPIGRIADENCHLYLWVTNRSLPKGFRLVEAWGFRYVTCLTWVKPSFGMGNYFRGSTEQVLFAVKGSQPLKRRDCGTHFMAARGCGHSAKPDEFYALVESCSHAPFIDVFGRRERDGWAVWGENAAYGCS